MSGSKAHARRWVQGVAAAAAIVAGAAQAQQAPTPDNSALDAPLFYQLMIGEIELAAGRAGNAYSILLDAARKSGDEGLYRRAVEIALRSQAGNEALAAVRAWRGAAPKSTDALRYQVQILLVLNRIDELAEPLGVWLNQASVAERPGLITALPRLLQRMSDRQQLVALLERLLAPFADQPETRTASRIAIARAQFNAGQTDAALAAVRAAQAGEPAAAAPVLLALEMLPGTAGAEKVVTDHLARADADPSIRLGYVRVLTQSQRYADAIVQLERVTRERPQLAQPWLTLGALQIELKRPRDGEASLQRYIELASKPAAASTEPDTDADDEDTPARTGLTQAWLLLAQAAEQRGDLKGAEAWLGKIDSSQRALEVQTRRAMLLARQGQLAKARALIQQVPEQNADDARAKLLAETQLLREMKRWREAIEVLTQANQRFADDTELLYEQAMIEEKLDRFPDMERLLRRVIALKPDHGHAHNALGYSMADRNDRLPEARDLIRRALELAPGDPFITDSLGWVEFRLGNGGEAARLLREAYRARPDTEIAAHLGEVLWANGQREEARRIWAEARGRDAGNEVLRATLARLKVGL